jgi:hypothetical protein
MQVAGKLADSTGIQLDRAATIGGGVLPDRGQRVIDDADVHGHIRLES